MSGADAVREALRKRFAPPEWACFFEVRNGTGFAKGVTRYADALAMNLFPSRGLEVHGVEIKVSRSDWQRELKNPEKSAEIQQFCDRWWIAVPDDKIVAEGELPPTWGLVVLRGDRLVQKVAAPKLEAREPDRGFIAALLRTATEGSVPKFDVQREIDERVESLLKSEREAHALLSERFHVELAGYEEAIAKFEEASGVRIETYNAEKIGEAVRYVLRHRGRIGHELEWARRKLAELVETLEREGKAIDGGLVEGGSS